MKSCKILPMFRQLHQGCELKMEILGVGWGSKDAEVSKSFRICRGCLLNARGQKVKACNASFLRVFRVDKILSLLEYTRYLQGSSAKLIHTNNSCHIHHLMDSLLQHGEGFLQLQGDLQVYFQASAVHTIARNRVARHKSMIEGRLRIVNRWYCSRKLENWNSGSS